jgi:hypothetical protein
MIRRILALVLAAGLLLLVGAGPAAADPPTIQWLPSTDHFVLPADVFCPGFDVQVDVHQRAKLIIFGDGGAMFAAIGSGSIFETLTNLSTGHSITLNVSGPAFFDETGLPFVGSGTWAIFLPGDPGQILYLVGRMEFQPEPYGISPTLVRGRSIDLCPSL